VAYTDNATRQFEALVGDTAAQYIKVPLKGPLRLEVFIVLPRPQRLMRNKDPQGFIWAPKRPDADNILKAVTDGMQTCFQDDAQIVHIKTTKVYAEKEGKSRIIVYIAQISPMWPIEDLIIHSPLICDLRADQKLCPFPIFQNINKERIESNWYDEEFPQKQNGDKS
jgi:Holliday junction resolvase RusA-like endonuclease